MRRLILAALMSVPPAALAQTPPTLTLSGTPTAPTAPPGTNSSQIATTAFVLASAGTAATGTPTSTGTTPISTIAAGTNASAAMVALPGLPGRTLQAQRMDVYNARDYGAVGNGSQTPISSQFPSSATASLAAFAAQSISGSTPYAWMTNPAFGLTFSMATSTAQSAAGTTLAFIEQLSGYIGWSATVATWQDPAHGNDLVAPGMLVSGTCIASGTTVAAVGRTPGAGGYGTITLSTATASACGSGTNVTFTIAPSQLQSLTTDWLGIQTAMAAAWMNTAYGGSVYIPAGNYILNHSLVNAGGITDTSGETPNLDVRGDGVAVTRLVFPSDLGGDTCALGEPRRGPGVSSLSKYHDFRIIGPNYASVLGSFPNQMDGLCIGESAAAYDIAVSNMHAGINVIKDHWWLRDIESHYNGYGIYLAPYTDVMGNETIDKANLTNNTVASLAVAATDQLDASNITATHTGFGPYGIYDEAASSSVSSITNGFLSNTVLDNVTIEATGNAFIYGPYNYGMVTGNDFIGGIDATLGMSQYKIANVPTPALIDVGVFNQNVMTNTNWSAYGAVTDAIVEATKSCSQNDWIGDIGFVTGATSTVPPLKCQSIFQNLFSTPAGSGTFFSTQAAIPVSYAVLGDLGTNVAAPYQDGEVFAGLAASPAPANATVAVETSNTYAGNAPKANTAESIATAEYLYPTAGGLAGSVSPRGSVGMAFFYSGSGSATVIAQLGPAVGNSPAKGAAGLTAQGTSQVNATVLTSTSNQFTNVPAGSGAVLPPLALGDSVTIFNDGANALLVYPPAGGQIGRSDVNAGVSIVPSGSATFRKLTASLWHQ